MAGASGTVTLLRYFLYRGTQPYHGKSSPVQKGLIISQVDGGADLCEEGVGFGLPILQYARDFLFPGSSTVAAHGELTTGVWWKQFQFDLIERRGRSGEKRVGMFSWVFPRIFNRLYKAGPGRLVVQASEKLGMERRPGLEPPVQRFIRVRGRGSARVTYDLDVCKKQTVVTIDLEDVVRTGLERIYISNEAGARAFTLYIDSSGLRLHADEITPWAKVNATWAMLYAPARGVGFRVEIPETCSAFRGRETIGADISWSGIILCASPSAKSIQYMMRFGSLKELFQETAHPYHRP